MFFFRHPKPVEKRGADVVQQVKQNAEGAAMNTRVIVIESAPKPSVAAPKQPK